MRLSAWFPTRDIGTDPAKIRDWAQAAEDLGYAGIEVADHVFGAVRTQRRAEAERSATVWRAPPPSGCCAAYPCKRSSASNNRLSSSSTRLVIPNA